VVNKYIHNLKPAIVTNTRDSIFSVKAANKHGGCACHLLCCSSYSSTLKMETIFSTETSVAFHRTTRRYIPEYNTLKRRLTFGFICFRAQNIPQSIIHIIFLCMTVYSGRICKGGKETHRNGLIWLVEILNDKVAVDVHIEKKVQ
jgi:hypothetical protein